mgnify:CR=1 FL=1
MKMAAALKTVRRVPDGERAVLRKLLARHADDFDAMARDGRLNQYQHTAAHLRRRAADEDESNDVPSGGGAPEHAVHDVGSGDAPRVGQVVHDAQLQGDGKKVGL